MDQEIDFANIGVSIWLFSLEQNAISSHMSQISCRNELILLERAQSKMLALQDQIQAKYT